MMPYAWEWVHPDRENTFHREDPSGTQAEMIEDNEGEHIQIVWWPVSANKEDNE